MERFDLYVKRYCESYHVSPEEAIKHQMVQIVLEYYKKEIEGGLE